MGRKKGKKSKTKELPLPPLDDDYDDSFVPSCVLDDSEEDVKGKEEILQHQEALAKEEEEKKKQIREEKRMKKQEKKMQKAKEEEERQNKIRIAKLTGPNPRLIESNKINEQISPLNLCIREVPADGNCLYTAIAQRYSILHDQSVTQGDMRAAAAKFIRQHPDDFIPFLNYEEGNAEDHFLQYCDKVENSTEWGGELELRALSSSLSVPITVYSVMGEPRTFGDNFPSEPLLISFHNQYYTLGAHYNAVVPK